MTRLGSASARYAGLAEGTYYIRVRLVADAGELGMFLQDEEDSEERERILPEDILAADAWAREDPQAVAQHA